MKKPQIDGFFVVKSEKFMPINNTLVENQPEIGGDNENLRENILKKREELNKKENIINSQQITRENKLKLNKEKIISELFQVMQSAGVNLDDISSIQKFLADLEARDPDLRELFESAINAIIGEQEQKVLEDNGLMNKFNNLGQDMMMPR